MLFENFVSHFSFCYYSKGNVIIVNTGLSSQLNDKDGKKQSN